MISSSNIKCKIKRTWSVETDALCLSCYFWLSSIESQVKGLMMSFANLRGLCQGGGDLCAAIKDCHPGFVRLDETHLDSTSIGMCLPPGYTVAARKDRTHHGSVVCFFCVRITC